jgi:hypothetical protein
MQSDRHERISERAYRIWVAEGRVHGKDQEHWRRAEREIAEEERRVAGALADRAAGATETAAPRARRQPQTRPPSGANTAAPTRRGRRAPTGDGSG